MEENTKNILDLDDDCLIHICNFVESYDLLTLFQANTLFHNAIGAAVMNVEIELYEMGKIVERFFEKFGSGMRKLNIWTENTQWTEYIIQKYISRENIQHCIFPGYSRIDIEFIERNSYFFKSLKSLAIECATIDQLALQKLSTIILNLKEFSICFENSMSDLTYFLSNLASCPLEVLSLWQVNFDFEIKHIHGNIPVMKNLKRLKMQIDCESIDVLKTFPNIHSLYLMLHPNIFPDLTLQHFGNLKVLTLRMEEIDEVPNSHELIAGFLKQLIHLNTLELLSLTSVYGYTNFTPEIIRIICKMTNLKTLSLYGFLTLPIACLLSFSHSLKNLRTMKMQPKEIYLGTNEKSIIYGFIGVCANLSTLTIGDLELIPDIDLDQFYDTLATIRENQINKNVLTVNIRNGNERFIQKSKWVKMNVSTSCVSYGPCIEDL